ncbi:hypothetical protein CTI12_AA435660 [Artemisia annua]|uniref:arginine--tRNA ligase n=1 Tax=Artemisia annua TaxID=35608 RepID=A0A2U1LRA4_ARTAN|nr:hypothetical protein CTI12_AA435660 [Artemisia annua]
MELQPTTPPAQLQVEEKLKLKVPASDSDTTPAAKEEDNRWSLQEEIAKVLTYALWGTFPPCEEAVSCSVSTCTKEDGADYLCTSVLHMWPQVRDVMRYNGPKYAGLTLMDNLKLLGYDEMMDRRILKMMMTEFLVERFPNGEVNDQAIGELEVLYKESKKRFDEDAEFRERAQQGWDERHHNAWVQICKLNKERYQKVYQRMGVHVKEEGNTAVYLQYTHVRICSIIRKSSKGIKELKVEELILKNEEEREFGLHLLRFTEVLKEVCTVLMPHILCDYLYDLCMKFDSLYSSACQADRSCDEETAELLLCEAAAIVMEKCFHLLRITPIYKIYFFLDC